MTYTQAKFTVLFMLFLSLSTIPAISQSKTNKASVLEGPETEAKRSSVRDICGYDANGYYIVRQQKTKLFLEHINKSMMVDKSAEIADQKIGKLDLDFSYCQMLDGNLYMFSVLKDTKASVNKMYYQVVSTSTLLPDNKPKEIASSAYITKRIMLSSFSMGGSFTNVHSPDESHLLVYSSEMSKDEGSEEKERRYSLRVFDSKLQKEWEKEISLPFSSSVLGIEDIKIDDHGNVYIIGIEYQERSDARISRREGKPTYKYHLFRYANKGQDELEMPIELTGKFITDVQIDGAPNGDIIASGFYSESGTFSIKGAFYMSIDAKTQGIKVKQLSEFETDFITQYYSEREKKKEKKKEEKGDEPELYQFRLDNLLIREDGGVTLIAEQYYVTVTTYTTYNSSTHTTTTHTDYHYNYNDILVLSFNNTGMVEWKTKIPKRQVSTNDGGYYSSYNLSVVGDKLYFIFNDNPKNLFLKPGEQPYYYNRAKELAVVLVEVDATGKYSRELLMTTERGDLVVRPKMCAQTGAREVLICSERSKVYQFGKVEFK